MSRYAIEALERGLSVLSLFTHERAELSLTEIARATDISMTTTVRIASTLEHAGYLHRDPDSKRYRPALKVLQLGFSAVRSLDVREVARPHLEELSQRTGETVSHAALDKLEIVYIDRVRNRQIVGVILGIGSRLPAHCTSMGKVMLAYLPEEELAGRLGGASLTSCTTRTVIVATELLRELKRVRQRGYALNQQELAIGLRAVAAPIRDESGAVVAAINISGSTESISLNRLRDDLAPQVVQTAARISQGLGYMEAATG